MLTHVGDNDKWFSEWKALACEVESLAVEEENKKHFRTAGGAFFRAATYYYLAEVFISPEDPRKFESYKKVMNCFQRGAFYRYPGLEKVDIPYEKSSLAGYFFPGRDFTSNKRSRTMVFFDGLDNCKEIITHYASELVARGINCLVVDGPGQGESLRIRKIPSRFDYEVPATCAFEYVAQRPEVDTSRIGLMARSMGGYYAPRAVAFERRYRICVAWGAHFDYYGVWLKRRKVMENGGTTTSSPHFQLPWVMGKKSMDEAMTKLKDYTLEGIAQEIRCPLLIVHGENDIIVPVEMAHALYRAAGTNDKTLKIFTTEETGSEHCGDDNQTKTISFIADWVSDHL